MKRVDRVIVSERHALIVLQVDERSAFCERAEKLGLDMSPVRFDVSTIAAKTNSDFATWKIEIDRLDVELRRTWVAEQKRR